jgi:ATP-dependent protease Clp ATPase subunit
MKVYQPREENRRKADLFFPWFLEYPASPGFFIIGEIMIFPQQEHLVRQISHLLNVFTISEANIRPHFHLTGSSGSGKSFLIAELTEMAKLPFIEVNAAQLTAEGLSGNSLSKALRKLREHWNVPNVVFVDEFDKLFQRNGETTENFRSIVQDEFLTAMESKYTSIFTDYGKYEPVRIDNSLFIFAGAYSNQKIESLADLRGIGMRTEFVGRVPLVLCAQDVPIQELVKHITKVDLYQQYMKLYPNLVERKVVREITLMLKEQSKEIPIGIRLLNTVIHQYFLKDVL